jgi:hypothetical protein
MEGYLFTLSAIADPGTNYEKKWEKTYNNAYEAVKDYISYVDWGFAAYGKTITLTEPNGKTHTKTFIKPGAEGKLSVS